MSDLHHAVHIRAPKGIADRSDMQGDAALWLWDRFGPRGETWSSESYDHYMEYRFATEEQAFEFKMNFG